MGETSPKDLDRILDFVGVDDGLRPMTRAERILREFILWANPWAWVKIPSHTLFPVSGSLPDEEKVSGRHLTYCGQLGKGSLKAVSDPNG